MDVCILTAGRGTRLGEAGLGLNKGLLPLQNKAAISHLIERFPADTRFVIAVGHLAQQVEEYLRLAHPESETRSRIELVPVVPFEGPGSGPGTSALCCERFLPGPFFLVCSDTYWPPEEAILTEPADNVAWTGSVAPSERREYCNFTLERNRVISIQDKTQATEDSEAWVGFAFIRDRNAFFDGIRGSAGARGEVQLSRGLEALVRAGKLKAQKLPGWLDIGTAERYNRARIALDGAGFEKIGEHFYRLDNRVLKFFEDPMIVRNRVERAKVRPELFPEILGQGRSFFSYRYVEGVTLAEKPDVGVLLDLLRWMSDVVWKRRRHVPADFRAQCTAFYKTRTAARVTRCELRLQPADREAQRINGQRVPEVHALLDQVLWKELSEGVATFIHGDLQLDNVVVCLPTETRPFRLIDWRQDFAGTLEYGDLYYDFGKLIASLELDFRAVARGEFQIERASQELVLEAPSVPDSSGLRSLVENYAVQEEGLDPSRLRILVALIYLNMAGLHSGEESRLLYLLGRLRLSEALAARATSRPATRISWSKSI